MLGLPDPTAQAPRELEVGLKHLYFNAGDRFQNTVHSTVMEERVAKSFQTFLP